MLFWRDWCGDFWTVFGKTVQKKSREKFRGGKERQRKKKKKKVFFGSVCGSCKTVEIIKWCEVKTIAKWVDTGKFEYFKWWVTKIE